MSRKAGIKPCWNRQIEAGNHAGKHRPLPVGTKGLGCGSVIPSKNPLLRNWRTKPELERPEKFTFDSWCNTPDGLDREDLVVMEGWSSSAVARREAKAVGGGKKVAMKFWLRNLVTGKFIVPEGARRYYSRFMSEMTERKYATLDQRIS